MDTKLQKLSQLSDKSRLWIYGFSHTLSQKNKSCIEHYIEPFLKEWNAHGTVLNGHYLFLYSRFLVLCVEPENCVSGCSIDASIRVLKHLREEHQLDALQKNLIFFLHEDLEIMALERQEFQDYLLAHSDPGKIIVFDNTISSLGDLRHGSWEKYLEKSWHQKAFRLPKKVKTS